MRLPSQALPAALPAPADHMPTTQAAAVPSPTTRSLGSLSPSAEVVVGKASQVYRVMHNKDKQRVEGAVVVVVGREQVGSLMDRGLKIKPLALAMP